MPTFDSGGVAIHYVDEGSGPAIVLVHGFAASVQANWRAPGIIDAWWAPGGAWFAPMRRYARLAFGAQRKRLVAARPSLRHGLPYHVLQAVGFVALRCHLRVYAAYREPIPRCDVYARLWVW